VAFSAFGMMSLFIAGKLGTFSRNAQTTGWQLVATIMPLAFACWIALSRYSDYHHHASGINFYNPSQLLKKPQRFSYNGWLIFNLIVYLDIFVGSLLGLTVGYLSYRMYYPSLAHSHSHYPSAWLYYGIIDFEVRNKISSRYQGDVRKSSFMQY